MEKYIRVEDGIYEFVDFEKTEGMRCLNHYGYRDKRGIGFLGTLSDFREYKKADNIPELCDGFIITSKQGHIYDSYGDYSYELKGILPQAREELPDEDWNLYGCILVDGIIKQVAIFNDEKGEMELLWKQEIMF